jgi:hypothetical protein
MRIRFPTRVKGIVQEEESLEMMGSMEMVGLVEWKGSMEMVWRGGCGKEGVGDRARAGLPPEQMAIIAAIREPLPGFIGARY